MRRLTCGAIAFHGAASMFLPATFMYHKEQDHVGLFDDEIGCEAPNMALVTVERVIVVEIGEVERPKWNQLCD